MKKNKIITWIVMSAILVLLGFGVYRYYFKEDSKSTLTINEKQWIESNKNSMIDFGITSNLEVFTNGGTGVAFDFLTALEENTKLEFNKVPFNKGDKITTDYSFQVVEKLGKEDIVVYQDHYVLLSNSNTTYSSVRDITDKTIGTLKADVKEVDRVLEDRNALKYQTFDSVEKLIEAVEEKEVDAIALPKMYYLSEIGSHKKLNISYNITEMKRYYVIRLGKTEKLNTILKKYYKKWAKEQFDTSFNENFKSSYFSIKNVDEESKSTFTSKKYVYGYVGNRPYYVNINGSLYGYNLKQIDQFAKMAGIEIEYQEYSSYKELIDAFNTNKVDFFYQNVKKKNYSIDTYQAGSHDAQVAVVSPLKTKVKVNTLNSLKGMKVLTLKDSKIEAALEEAKADVIGYDNLDSLMKHLDDASILVIDFNTYQFYRHTTLKEYKIDLVTSIGTYGYLVRDIKANRVLERFLDFYLDVVADPMTVNDSIYTLLKLGNKPYIFRNLLVAIASIVIVILAYFGVKKYKEVKSSNITVSKADKLKYIDMLTSLKNRTYLNDHIEKWDNSDVYPQTIIIVDLNNIAYINDNYGHQAGDNIIKEAANKLITSQIENSDIIRTNGNEFLIYLVGYTEKQIITYIRKLNKEMKELSHGYGAAVGYSMIHDEIKTIDDAVNEATLDMRNNKEELK